MAITCKSSMFWTSILSHELWFWFVLIHIWINHREVCCTTGSARPLQSRGPTRLISHQIHQLTDKKNKTLLKLQHRRTKQNSISSPSQCTDTQQLLKWKNLGAETPNTCPQQYLTKFTWLNYLDFFSTRLYSHTVNPTVVEATWTVYFKQGEEVSTQLKQGLSTCHMKYTWLVDCWLVCCLHSMYIQDATKSTSHSPLLSPYIC